MNTGEDIGGLRKIADFTRLISLVILSIHFYMSCYLAFRLWGFAAGITDRLIGNVAKTGLFDGYLLPKAAALLCLVVSLLAVKGRKDEKIRKRDIGIYLTLGIIIYFASAIVFVGGFGPQLTAGLYIGMTTIGYLLMLTGGGMLSRLIKSSINTDVFNSENETFPQEERLIENEYSVNLPAKYNLKGKIRDSYINIINPFRGLLVTGTPGSGKGRAKVIL
ncbi:YWFCY protein [Pedobacter rhizosphaerae]|uniref:YWFCY protein n=1 Tax=Pedobacter rhizosphaerae TaxID=390241 RepID=A0A1H9VPY8_9SPHI|nr:YWFCY protein [Pedobacter rhizosphaerae]